MNQQELAMIQVRFDAVAKDLRETLATFQQKDLNVSPFEGSWSASEDVEHMDKAMMGVVMLLNGEGIPTNRDPAEKVGIFADIFLNFNTKLQSPPDALPSGKEWDKEDLTNLVEKTTAAMSASIGAQNLSQICANFEFPTVGPITKLEAVHFVIYHTERHVLQLKNIAKHF